MQTNKYIVNLIVKTHLHHIKNLIEYIADFFFYNL